MSVFEDESIALWFYISSGGNLFKSRHVDFVIEMTDVSYDGVILHLLHVFSHDDILVTGGGDEYISFFDNCFKSNDSKTFH